MSRRRREEEIRRARRVFAISMGLAIAILAVIVIYVLMQPIPTGYYTGVYREELDDLFKKFMNDPRWNDTSIYADIFRYVFYNYYRKLYNTSMIMNKTFSITRYESTLFTVFLGAYESLYVETRGNGTYYYILTLDERGRIRLMNQAIPGNSSREITVSETLYLTIMNTTKQVILYNDTYLLFLTNSTIPVKGYVFINKTPPTNLSRILDIYPVEYTVWLFENWIRDRYEITPVDPDKIGETRPPWTIYSENVTEITSLEACILLYKLYNFTGIESHIIAIDLDGDRELDHFALAIKYDRGPRAFGNAILNYILRDANIYVSETRFSFKHAITETGTWIILDPVYELKYVPACIVGVQYYDNLGIVL